MHKRWLCAPELLWQEQIVPFLLRINISCSQRSCNSMYSCYENIHYYYYFLSHLLRALLFRPFFSCSHFFTLTTLWLKVSIFFHLCRIDHAPCMCSSKENKRLLLLLLRKGIQIVTRYWSVVKVKIHLNSAEWYCLFDKEDKHNHES